MAANETTPSEELIRLLLVDDEEGFVSVMTKRLEKRNIIATPALSGAEAIDKFRNQDFDVVLLDLKMEFMDGIEVLKVLKEINPKIPVIMMTGHGSVEEAQESLEYAAVDCFPKPYEFEKVVSGIREIHRELGGTENG